MPQKPRSPLPILAIWLLLALAAGVFGLVGNASAPGVAITVWSLTGLALLGVWIIPSIRSWAASVDLRCFVALHLTRFVGIYFLVLGHRGALPQDFAAPAGIGDILVAFGAVTVLLLPGLRSRPWLLAWNTLGLIDIVFVVITALRCGLRDWLSMAPLREFPLSLLLTFLVPLIIASHIVIFIRLARSPSVH